jgi:hypothetical protein
MSTPLVVGRWVDENPVNGFANRIFPDAGVYADAQILALIVGGCLALVTLLAYCTGHLCRAAAHFDAYASAYALQRSMSASGFRPVLRSTKYGGAMTLAAMFVAAAVCADTLIEYSCEWQSFPALLVLAALQWSA